MRSDGEEVGIDKYGCMWADFQRTTKIPPKPTSSWISVSRPFICWVHIPARANVGKALRACTRVKTRDEAGLVRHRLGSARTATGNAIAGAGGAYVIFELVRVDSEDVESEFSNMRTGKALTVMTYFFSGTRPFAATATKGRFVESKREQGI